MSRPTLYLSNWSSAKTPGQHGPGRKFCAMAAPRAWEYGHGFVPRARPSIPALTAVLAGRMSVADYRRSCEGRFAPLSLLHPGMLEFWPVGVTAGTDAWRPVEDGDTLCCACARPDSKARKHPCHLEILTPFLVRAGWRAVLWGRRVRMECAEPLCNPVDCGHPDHGQRAVYADTGEPYDPADYGWPEVTS